MMINIELKFSGMLNGISEIKKAPEGAWSEQLKRFRIV